MYIIGYDNRKSLKICDELYFTTSFATQSKFANARTILALLNDTRVFISKITPTWLLLVQTARFYHPV